MVDALLHLLLYVHLLLCTYICYLLYVYIYCVCTYHSTLVEFSYGGCAVTFIIVCECACVRVCAYVRVHVHACYSTLVEFVLLSPVDPRD